MSLYILYLFSRSCTNVRRLLTRLRRWRMDRAVQRGCQVCGDTLPAAQVLASATIEYQGGISIMRLLEALQLGRIYVHCRRHLHYLNFVLREVP